MPVAVEYAYRPDIQVHANDGWPSPPYQHVLMALEEGRITLRDLVVLKELAYSQFLTRNQIHFLCMPSVGKSVVRRRLEVLDRLGCITAIRWEEPREGNTPMQRVAYSLALNGAKLLQHHYGRMFPWRPGTAQKHIKRILSVLAANEFRLQVETQRPGSIDDWQIFGHPVGPVARFNLGAQMVLVETPRDDEDVFVITPNRYTRWIAENPLFLFITPTDVLASRLFNQLQEDLTPERLLFTTDDRAFNAAVDSKGYLWQWSATGETEALSLV